MTLATEDDATKITITPGSSWPDIRPVSAELERDPYVAPGGRLLRFQVLGEVGNEVLILTDTYPSLPGGLSYCRAGEERFLRVLAIAEQQLRETLRLKLDSCREDIELGSDGVLWSPKRAELSIHWLLGPNHDQQETTRVYRITPSGKADLVTKHQ